MSIELVGHNLVAAMQCSSCANWPCRERDPVLQANVQWWETIPSKAFEENAATESGEPHCNWMRITSLICIIPSQSELFARWRSYNGSRIKVQVLQPIVMIRALKYVPFDVWMMAIYIYIHMPDCMLAIVAGRMTTLLKIIVCLNQVLIQHLDWSGHTKAIENGSLLY